MNLLSAVKFVLQIAAPPPSSPRIDPTLKIAKSRSLKPARTDSPVLHLHIPLLPLEKVTADCEKRRASSIDNRIVRLCLVSRLARTIN